MAGMHAGHGKLAWSKPRTLSCDPSLCIEVLLSHKLWLIIVIVEK